MIEVVFPFVFAATCGAIVGIGRWLRQQRDGKPFDGEEITVRMPRETLADLLAEYRAAQ